MRAITNKIKNKLIFNEKDYFIKTKYSLDSDFINLIFLKKSGFENSIVYELRPFNNGYFIKLKDGQELNPDIFSNEHFDFKKFYLNDIGNDMQNIKTISNILNLRIIYHSNLFYEMFSKFNVIAPNKYNITNPINQNDTIFYSENIFYFDLEFKNLKFFSKYYLKEFTNLYAVKLNDYKKELLHKYVAEPLNKNIDTITFKDLSLLKMINYN